MLDAANIEDLQDLRFRVDLALRLTEAKSGSSEFDLEVPDKVKTAAGAHAKEVNKLARQVADKDITLAEYDKRVRKATEKRFREAYRAGKGTDLDAGDEEWLRRATDEEVGYAKKFGRDQRSDKGTMGRAQRSAMYGKALEGISLHGAVESLPDDARIDWRLGPAEHCPDCLVLAASGPYTKWNLPTTPRAGSTQCRCVTDPGARVLTRRGLVPIVEIEVGDFVFTHRGRWRRVLAIPVHEPGDRHIQAAVLAPSGRVVGFTSDHKVKVDEGWSSIEEVVEHGGCMQAVCDEVLELWDKDSKGFEDWNVQGLPFDLSDVQEEEGSEGHRVYFVRYESQGKIAVGEPILQEEDSQGFGNWWKESQETVRRFVRGMFQKFKSRWQGLCVLLGRTRETPICLQISVAMGAGERPCSEQHEVGRWQGVVDLRDVRQEVQELQEGNVRRQALLQQGVCRRGEDQGTCSAQVRNMWKKVRAKGLRAQKVKGQILLGEVLPREPLLYDLTVDEDCSFVVEGLVVHNSNCRCFLKVRVGKLTATERKDAERYGGKRREKLRDLLRPKPPKGMRRPDPDEALAIDEMRTKMNFFRRKLAKARDAGADAEVIRELAMARRDVNDRLIGFLEDRSIYDVPVLSVDDVITGADIGAGAQAEVMRAGLDGATLGLLDDKRLGSMLARFVRLARVALK